MTEMINLVLFESWKDSRENCELCCGRNVHAGVVEGASDLAPGKLKYSDKILYTKS